MATELRNLSIEEVSGVDSPANETPGWIVMKSEDGPAKAAAELAAVYSTLNGMTSIDPELLPEDVRKNMTGLNDFLEEVLTDESETEESRPESLVEKVKRMFTKPADDEGEVEKKKKPPVEDAEDAADGGADEAAEGEGSGEEKAPKKVKKELEPEPVEITKAVDERVSEQMEPVTKALGEIAEGHDDLREENDILKQALEVTLDRVDALEQYAAGSLSLEGQDDTLVEKRDATFQDAIRSAARGNRVQLG